MYTLNKIKILLVRCHRLQNTRKRVDEIITNVHMSGNFQPPNQLLHPSHQFQPQGSEELQGLLLQSNPAYLLIDTLFQVVDESHGQQNHTLFVPSPYCQTAPALSIEIVQISRNL